MELKQKYFIDSHKGFTPIFIIILLYIFGDNKTDISAYVYLALHGTYGILWILKSYIYPDKQWENKTGISYGLLIWIGLSLYFISPIIIIVPKCYFSDNIVSIIDFFSFKVYFESYQFIYIACCISMYIFGVFLHFVSDMQKYVSLKLNPGSLITTEMFSKIRNTNYLGELLIYMGFSLLSYNFLPLLALLLFIVFIWIPNMIKKDKSLSRYSEFEQYKKSSSKFFPFIF